MIPRQRLKIKPFDLFRGGAMMLMAGARRPKSPCRAPAVSCRDALDRKGTKKNIGEYFRHKRHLRKKGSKLLKRLKL
jgi:hypothetical protein